MSTEFPCERCGACCRNVDKAQETSFLDRGDGACRHYDDRLKLCSIYESRPDICRVDLQFAINYRQLMDWSSFVRLNLDACEALQRHDALQAAAPDSLFTETRSS